MNYALIALVALLAVVGTRRLYASFVGELLDPERARALVDEGALLVDVRSPEEYAQGHIEGAKNIPVGIVAAQISAFGRRERDIVLYCRSGARSGRAKAILQQHGFTAAHNLGAMRRW